jgi:sRNA-binding carbon storage regulator CsrA
MLVLSRSKNQKVFAGASQPNNQVPFSNSVVEIDGNNVKLGYESHTSNGKKSKLLSIFRDDTQTSCDLDKQLKLDDPDKKLLKEYFDKKVFFRNRGIKNFNNLKQVIEKLKEKSPEKIQEIVQFLSFVKNGAFFKHWADHYTKQAQKMSKSLGLTA